MINEIMPKVFLWMFIGLLVTFGTGIVVCQNPNMLYNIFGSMWLWVIIIVELLIVIFLATRITKMKPTTAKIAFIAYSFISGLTFSSIFITYELKSIIWVFLIAAAMFGGFALFGYITKKDLTKIGNLAFMALIGVFICSIVNIFLKNSTFDTVISIITILVFVGFTAYDMQKIKQLSESELLPADNIAIYGALQLYLDFINIFLELLQLLGNNNNN